MTARRDRVEALYKTRGRPLLLLQVNIKKECAIAQNMGGTTTNRPYASQGA